RALPPAVTLAKEDHLLLLDCRSQEVEHIAFFNPDITVVIANTNVSHNLAESEYGKRREQCEEAAKALGIESLRDASWMQLEMSKDKMSEVVFRRARHVITEIERTVNCANRLQAGEWTAVASLLFASHDSLREDYEVSCEELDTLVDIARLPGFDGLVYGSRMTGGGFGGSTVSLVHRDIVDRFYETLSNSYKAKTGIEATIFVVKPSASARLV
ncbi:MAG: galactokinase, partial [Verrucomicrobiota bacterium]